MSSTDKPLAGRPLSYRADLLLPGAGRDRVGPAPQASPRCST
ncbi:hypothetical protein ACFWN2_26295 [Lentzea sp. NPDC058436]